jgi:tetratricopeptide (TPR) repeat protein/4-amino-4-deoxy-L-arabinose transferase-like glycosyltransferase
MIGVFLLAAGVRGAYLWQSAANPTFYAPVVDAETYHTMACTLVGRVTTDEAYATQRGADVTHAGFFWQPFFYPSLLSVIYFFAGPSILAAKIVQILIGGVTCSLTYLLGRVAFRRAVGVIAAVIVAFYGPLIYLEGELLGEGLAAFWSLVLVLLFLKAGDGRSHWMILVIGLCGAMAILTRPTFLPFFLAGCLWLGWVLYRAGGWRRLLTAVSNGLAGFVIVAFPVAALNRSRTGNFAMLPSSGGVNLYIGNNPDVCKTLTIRPGWAWEKLTTWPEREGIRGDAAQQAFFYKKVREYAAEQPLSFLAGVGMKIVRFLSTREIPRNVDVYMFGRWSSLLRALVWKAGPFGFPFGLLLPLAVAGVICHWRRIPLVLALFLILYSLGVVAVFVTGRYRVPVIPALAVVAAAGLVGLRDLVRRRKFASLAVAVVCMAAAAAAGTMPGPFCEEQVNYEAELNFDLGTVYRRMWPPQYAKAEGYFTKALELNSDYADAYNELGNIRAVQGDLVGAFGCYSRAVELDPTHAKAMTNVGLMAYKMDRNDEAMHYFRMTLRLDPRAPKTHYFHALALSKAGDYPGAVEHFLKALELLNPLTDRQHILQAHRYLAEVLTKAGRPVEAVEHYRKALEMKGDYLPAIEGLAWLLATHPDAAVRNGSEAVRLAEHAVAIAPAGSRSLDVLGAAYAECGRFPDAVNAAGKALATAQVEGQTAEAQEIRARLELYRSARAYRQPPGVRLQTQSTASGDLVPASQPGASDISR